MQAGTLLLLILAVVVALAFAVFHYFFKESSKPRYPWLLVFFRFIAILVPLILLINPEIRTRSYYSEKPHLLLLVDNSSSITASTPGTDILDFVAGIKENPRVKERFEVEIFSFGEQVSSQESLNFGEQTTDIAGAFHSLRKLYRDSIAPVVLITDGNQTYGENFVLAASSYPSEVFPVLVGDTTTYQDISLERVHVNRYAFLRNNFPVELFLNYAGEEAVQTNLSIRNGETILYSEAVNLDGNRNSRVLEVSLPAQEVGLKKYTVELSSLNQERNTANNRKDFYVEIIDERASILLLSAISHPDLGALKRSVESNQQREVDLQLVREFSGNLDEYELVILYQPTADFHDIITELEQETKGYFVITGTKTDWDWLNGSQEHVQREQSSGTEEYFPAINPDFREFGLGDLEFSRYPPLEDAFGELSGGALDILLHQEVQGTETGQALLATAEEDGSRYAFLFGEGIWKWRAQSFSDQLSFQQFDTFLGNLVQYLATQDHRERLSLTYENSYGANAPKKIIAHYYDKNFGLKTGGRLQLELQSQRGDGTEVFPFIEKAGRYELELGYLEASDYWFRVSVSGEDLEKKGAFTVREENLEDQFITANFQELKLLADKHGQALYFLKDTQRLLSDLLSNNTSVPVQKSRENIVPLVDWYYFLIIFLIAVSAEWFLRKYFGLI